MLNVCTQVSKLKGLGLVKVYKVLHRMKRLKLGKIYKVLYSLERLRLGKIYKVIGRFERQNGTLKKKQLTIGWKWAKKNMYSKKMYLNETKLSGWQTKKSIPLNRSAACEVVELSSRRRPYNLKKRRKVYSNKQTNKIGLISSHQK